MDDTHQVKVFNLCFACPHKVRLLMPEMNAFK